METLRIFAKKLHASDIGSLFWLLLVLLLLLILLHVFHFLLPCLIYIENYLKLYKVNKHHISLILMIFSFSLGHSSNYLFQCPTFTIISHDSGNTEEN